MSPHASTNVGDKVLVDQFADGDMVDVIGRSKGRGFAGTIKRHNFNRGPESHGSMNVRAPGSIGASAYPSRVIKGTRSSGHMGDVRVTIKGSDRGSRRCGEQFVDDSWRGARREWQRSGCPGRLRKGDRRNSK